MNAQTQIVAERPAPPRDYRDRYWSSRFQLAECRSQLGQTIFALNSLIQNAERKGEDVSHWREVVREAEKVRWAA